MNRKTELNQVLRVKDTLVYKQHNIWNLKKELQLTDKKELLEWEGELDQGATGIRRGIRSSK